MKMMMKAKARTEYTEGPEAWARFTNAMKKVIAVPREEIQRKIEQHRKQADMNPRKRGPKRKE